MSCLDALEQPRSTTPPGLPCVLVAAAALIDPDGRVLLGRRPEGKHMEGLWEFPGGKVQDGETPEFALTRELAEELAVETRSCCFSPAGFTSHSYEHFHLVMPLFACRMWKGVPKALEHSALKWVRPKDMYGLEMPPADLVLIDQLCNLLGQTGTSRN